MKELSVGEEIRIRCVEDDGSSDSCRWCAFNIMGFHCDSAACLGAERKDGKDVHFELMED